MADFFSPTEGALISGITPDLQALYQRIIGKGKTDLGQTLSQFAEPFQAAGKQTAEAYQAAQAPITADAIEAIKHAYGAKGLGDSSAEQNAVAKAVSQIALGTGLQSAQQQQWGIGAAIQAAPQQYDAAKMALAAGKPIGVRPDQPSGFSQVLGAGANAAAAYFGALPT